MKHHPIIGRDWHGQVNFKRQTDTSNLVRLNSPFRWHNRLIAEFILIVRAFQGKH